MCSPNASSLVWPLVLDQLQASTRPQVVLTVVVHRSPQKELSMTRLSMSLTQRSRPLACCEKDVYNMLNLDF